MVCIDNNIFELFCFWCSCSFKLASPGNTFQAGMPQPSGKNVSVCAVPLVANLHMRVSTLHRYTRFFHPSTCLNSDPNNESRKKAIHLKGSKIWIKTLKLRVHAG